MFRLLASIQLLLLPSDTTDLTRCPPRVVAITDIIMKVLNSVERSPRSTIGIKCFLRDYIGSTGNSFLSSQVALAIKEDSRVSEFILNAIDSFVTEQTIIVSFSQETNSFGDFSRRKLPHFNDARYVPVFPDSELLHFLLIIASNAAQSSQSNTVLKSICWCSKSAIQQPVSTDAFEMEDDDDWLDEDEDEFDDENSFVSTLNLREQELRNNLALYFATLDFDAIDSELIVEVVKLITALLLQHNQASVNRAIRR
ncbi:Oidioi.mRNA.OKI2018_I69.chr2.g5973.t1.cds [Oikopleura dioica]|uniref:Oidioi.mRNA.OKI2018_I69.chr2.g5973.t1.cds n=1 Tax=Oikopleura dioica TaxID=34765 RepID=A0ABN7T1H8_OIKDI|nr:Oidioi.mRNA.OKI2018_I69.chr2.g5973.t1.cds [Oikopleura dioica]